MAINRRMDKSSAKVLIQQNVTAVKRHETRLLVWITQAWNQEATAPTPVLSPGEPWTGEPGGLQPMGRRRVGHDCATSLSLFTFMRWRRRWHPLQCSRLENHGRRSLVGCSLWGGEESDTTARLPFHFSLSCIGEGNGNPLQGSCLENPRDGGAWWAAVYGITQSRTRLKRLSKRQKRTHSMILFFKKKKNPESGIPWWSCG